MKKESSYLYLFFFCTSRFLSLHSDVQGHPLKKEREKKKVFSGLGVFFCPLFSSCLFESFPFSLEVYSSFINYESKVIPRQRDLEGGKKAVTACENEGGGGEALSFFCWEGREKGLFSKVKIPSFFRRTNTVAYQTFLRKIKNVHS